MLKEYLSKAQFTALITNGHWQTIMPLYLTNYLIKVEYTRERIDTPDGDFIDLDWVNQEITTAPTVILFHGMEGNSQSHYSRRIMHYLQLIGWRGVVAHARSCSGEINHTTRCYHAGFTEDIKLVVTTVKQITSCQLFAAGVSLGGNALLKFLGEDQVTSQLVTAACTISVPFDLEQTSKTLDQGLNKRLYVPYFLDSLLPKMKIYAEKFPGNFELRPNVKTLDDFNGQYITQMFNFRNAVDYYRHASSIYYMQQIYTPVMLIQAANDPMITQESWPDKTKLPKNIRFIGLELGGHAGFIGNNYNLTKALLQLPQIMIQYYKKFI